MSQIFPQNKMAIHAKLQWPLERTTFKFSLLNQWRHSGNLCTHEECRTFEKIPQSVCQMLVTILRLLSGCWGLFIVFSPFHLSAGLLGGLGWKKVEDKLGSVDWRREKWWWPSLLLLCIAAHCSWWQWPKQRAKWGWPRRLGRHSIDGHWQLVWPQIPHGPRVPCFSPRMAFIFSLSIICY